MFCTPNATVVVNICVFSVVLIGCKQEKVTEGNIFSSAYGGHTDKVRKLLLKGYDVNARNENQQTPLHVAAFGSHAITVSLLISRGADINVSDMWGRSPLHYAAQKANSEVVAQLLSVGADVDSGDGQERTPLHCAVLSGSLAVTELLLEKGASISARDASGNSPHSMAHAHANSSIVDLLDRAKRERRYHIVITGIVIFVLIASVATSIRLWLRYRNELRTSPDNTEATCTECSYVNRVGAEYCGQCGDCMRWCTAA